MRRGKQGGWRWSWAVLATVFLCFAGRGTAADEPKPVTLTDKNNDGKVTLTKGQQLVVRLKITTGTGFTWVVAKKDAKLLEQVGKAAVEREKNRPGAPAMMVFKFKTLKTGKGTLALEYKRPFEKDKPAAKTFKVTVTVKEEK